MVLKVFLTKKASKDLLVVPAHIARKLKLWVSYVETIGLENVRKIKSFHDEPLKGQRIGQRSIRLNDAYRAIYVIQKEDYLEFVSIEEVNKHDY